MTTLLERQEKLWQLELEIAELENKILLETVRFYDIKIALLELRQVPTQ